ncbi:MAG: aminoacyl-tRNA hydrolase [Planctomycetota bacterium]|nr:MAG: aminoacyl-tRNA hydrolase [Planctomycetota bacterium]REJ93722.1 MAG: aminoacyl-tRNA hydrolase [Planctomycetota bacterium]REK25772.1 MAG: aminoacyl-tRNA hydrolase [Planctomycetota bacterium]REK46641.1 MAG: aminoacyl-tRNA hydrolase [Planctomycetota bacterium]
MLEVTSRIRIPLREFDFTFARSSGPGGQNVNKLNTKATLRWRVARSESLPAAVRGRFMEKYRRRLTADGDILVVSQRFRDQGRNVADCLTKLREMIAAVVPPPKVRKKTRPTRAARERRLAEKRAQSQRKQSRRAPRRDDD